MQLSLFPQSGGWHSDAQQKHESPRLGGVFECPKSTRTARSGWPMDLEAVATPSNIESEDRSFCVEVVCFGDAASVA